MQEHKNVVVEQIHPNKPDYHDALAFQAARKHEAFLQLLHESPTWMAEKCFNGMADQGLRDFDESPDKTKQYWAQHPDLFSLYFGKYGSSSKASSSHHLRPPTQVSFDLAKDDGYGRDEGLCNSIEIGLIAAREDFKRLVKRYQTKISITDSYSYEIPIHAPRPRRKQRIAADFEDMIERAKGYDPIPFAAYEAVHDAPERMLRQPGSDPAYQHQWQQPQDASWGLHQNYPEPGFVHGYPGDFTQWWHGQQLPPYQQCRPQPLPWYSQYHANQSMYAPEYHTRYQQQYQSQQPVSCYYGHFPLPGPAYAAHRRPHFNTYAVGMMRLGLVR